MERAPLPDKWIVPPRETSLHAKLNGSWHDPDIYILAETKSALRRRLPYLINSLRSRTMPGFDGSHATNSRLSDSYRPIMLLYHHSYITSDFHLLTFGAAAALQLRHPRLKGEDTSGDEAGVLRYDSRLIVSPYNLPDNLFDLTRYEPAVQDFAKALTFFTPVRHDYATADYLDSFNFSAVFDILRKITKLRGTSWQRRQFYVVTFRSQLKPVVDSEHLFKLDCNSHQEAIATGGLLKYWYGRKNDEYQNLATCELRKSHPGSLLLICLMQASGKAEITLTMVGKDRGTHRLEQQQESGIKVSSSELSS